jgi:PAS domain S-box-containing protein
MARLQELIALAAASDETSAVQSVADELTLLLAASVEREHVVAAELATVLLEQARARKVAEEELASLTQRVDNAQALANMGDYDWHIPTDTNRWSDQLYRIYGHEPQSFNATYERFLGHIHPDDRERITAIHQHSYATGEPYEMVERIVRPDGEVRYLSSNGQVVIDGTGSPIRMRGTCIDITDRVHAEEERQAAAVRLGEAHERRRQASEINDNVVQGLTAAIYALELEDSELSWKYLKGTLEAARKLMADLGGTEPGDVERGDLLRTTAADIAPRR